MKKEETKKYAEQKESIKKDVEYSLQCIENDIEEGYKEMRESYQCFFRRYAGAQYKYEVKKEYYRQLLAEIEKSTLVELQSYLEKPH